VTAAEFQALTVLAGKVLQRNFPNFDFVLIVSDGHLDNLATNCATNQEILDLIDSAVKQVAANPAPPALPVEVKA
jgi:hypothetical protein